MRPETMRVFEAASTLHYRHGIGDILSRRLFADGRIVIKARAFNCKPHIRTGRLIGRTVRMYRHQITLK